MKILAVIDNLGSGGAQRQLTLLAVYLKQRGHNVSVVTYNEGNFFEPILDENNIPIISIGPGKRILRPIKLALLFRRIMPDSVIAFNVAASLYAELASIFYKRWRLVVSERSAKPASKNYSMQKWIRLFHVFADSVTTNSNCNRMMIERDFGFLKKKTITIYNAVQLDRFRPIKGPDVRSITRFIVLASHSHIKNFAGLAQACRLLKYHGITQFRIDWFGSAAPGWLERDDEMRQKLQVEDVLFIHQPTREVVQELDSSDALILPSFWEGLSNALCEALAVGCPVLVSDVSDARDIVKHQHNGLLFDPTSPESIANAISEFISLSHEGRAAMRRHARVSAVNLFDPESFAARYEMVLAGDTPPLS